MNPSEQFLLGIAESERFEDSVIHIADTSIETEDSLLTFRDDEKAEMIRQAQKRGEQLLCSHGSWPPTANGYTLGEAATELGFEKTQFEGDAPDEVCSYCWANAIEAIEKAAEKPDDIGEKAGEVGFLMRWKQTGRAHDEWYDILVAPSSTFEELDSLLLRFSTLHGGIGGHMRVYGLEDEYVDSSLNIFPEEQYEHAMSASARNAAEVTIGEVTAEYDLWENDRLTMASDFGTPSRYYCIIKEVIPPAKLEARIEDVSPNLKTANAAIINEKRP